MAAAFQIIVCYFMAYEHYDRVYIFINEKADRGVAECIKGIRYGHRCLS